MDAYVDASVSANSGRRIRKAPESRAFPASSRLVVREAWVVSRARQEESVVFVSVRVCAGVVGMRRTSRSGATPEHACQQSPFSESRQRREKQTDETSMEISIAMSTKMMTL